MTVLRERDVEDCAQMGREMMVESEMVYGDEASRNGNL
jgi:hypothetical protein